MRLYDAEVSANAYKVRLLLSHLGRPYESVPADLGADVLVRLPQVPTVEEPDGFVVSGSDAVLVYLAQGSRYLPDDARAAARVAQWCAFGHRHHEPYLAVARALRLFVRPSAARDTRLAALAPQAEAALNVLDDALEDERFLAGSYSIADMALYAYTHLAPDAGFDLAEWPNIRAWAERVEVQRGFVPFRALAGVAAPLDVA